MEHYPVSEHYRSYQRLVHGTVRIEVKITRPQGLMETVVSMTSGDNTSSNLSAAAVIRRYQ